MKTIQDSLLIASAKISARIFLTLLIMGGLAYLSFRLCLFLAEISTIELLFWDTVRHLSLPGTEWHQYLISGLNVLFLVLLGFSAFAGITTLLWEQYGVYDSKLLGWLNLTVVPESSAKE